MNMLHFNILYFHANWLSKESIYLVSFKDTHKSLFQYLTTSLKPFTSKVWFMLLVVSVFSVQRFVTLYSYLFNFLYDIRL